MMNDVTLAEWNRVKKVCLLVARNPGARGLSQPQDTKISCWTHSGYFYRLLVVRNPEGVSECKTPTAAALLIFIADKEIYVNYLLCTFYNRSDDIIWVWSVEVGAGDPGVESVSRGGDCSRMVRYVRLI